MNTWETCIKSLFWVHFLSMNDQYPSQWEKTCHLFSLAETLLSQRWREALIRMSMRRDYWISIEINFILLAYGMVWMVLFLDAVDNSDDHAVICHNLLSSLSISYVNTHTITTLKMEGDIVGFHWTVSNIVIPSVECKWQPVKFI